LDENENIETFPSLNPKQIGFYRVRMLDLFKNYDKDLFDIDYLAFSDIAWKLYRIRGKESLKLISYLGPMNASDIISIVSNFIS
jgi:hypothetical protein